MDPYNRVLVNQIIGNDGHKGWNAGNGAEVSRTHVYPWGRIEATWLKPGECKEVESVEEGRDGIVHQRFRVININGEVHSELISPNADEEVTR